MRVVNGSRGKVAIVALAGVMGFTSAALGAASVAPEGKSVEGTTSVEVQSLKVEVSGRLGLGRLSGESNELVYTETGAKLSELNWKLDNIYMLNGGVSVQPLSWLRLNADIWVALNDGDGTMDDYDWRFSGADWSDWSHHEDVPLDKGIMFDLNAELPFYRHQGTTFSGFVGVKRDNWKWDAYGGSYVYSVAGYRDASGTFPAGEPGISYEQWWTVPYIGVGFTSKLTNWDLSGRVIASPFVQGEDEDIHHQRNLRFEEDFDSSAMWSLDFAATYHLLQNWGLTGAVKYQYYQEAKGSTTITDLVSGQRWVIDGDAAGADNTALLLSLSLAYSF
ncbi:omptin family outer membrane protease [Desulfogranum mediterraneum]|uniref:omptin family outer membrane protease n=1 Tax=Desulfogranum mediterraneum TaxID=160661 RepID=UPI00137801E8|nr:omptin family outer membrane protease [Desulfogranum mediterraneum]